MRSFKTISVKPSLSRFILLAADLHWCVPGDVGGVSTETRNWLAARWTPSDGTQKACPSQRSARRWRLAFLRSAPPDDLTGHDSDELRWRQVDFLGHATDRKGQKHTFYPLWLHESFVHHLCLISVFSFFCFVLWQKELVSNKQAGITIRNKASKNQLRDILV